MARPSRNTQFTDNNSGGSCRLVVKANGGSITVEQRVGSDWVVTDTFSKDGGWTLDTRGISTRYTPSGGAVFEVYK